MKGAFACLAIAACLAAGVANAEPITGEWSGTGTPSGSGSGSAQTMDLWINSALPTDPNPALLDLTGTAEITCIGSPDPTCGTGGVVNPIFGTFDILAFTTTHVGGVKLGSADNPTAFSGTFDGSATWGGIITSQEGTQESWTFTRPATSVPEPGTLALLSLGLAGVGVMRKRKTK